MADLLLELSKRPQMRKLVKGLRLPVPMPPSLPRATGPREDRPLAGKTIFTVAKTPLANSLRDVLESAGAKLTESEPRKGSLHAIVYDATGLSKARDLRSLYENFHPHIGKLRSGGRVVILARPPSEASDVHEAAARQATAGFMRSVAKELGRRGATANLLYVHKRAESRIEGPLRFLLEARSAFVTAQPIHVTTVSKKARGKCQWTRPLRDKVALVTGAARGIGAATARALAADGAHVFCVDRPAESALTRAVANDIRGTALMCDLAEEGAAELIAEKLAERGVDIVVHNAGVTRDKTLAKMSDAQWDLTMDVNLGAILEVTDALAKGPLRSGGRVICLSSVAGIAGNVGQTNYAASKAGVIGFVQDLAPRIGAKGITVNAIAPGFIETRMTERMPIGIREAARRLSALGQGGRPSDVAQAVAFLAMPQASGVTGNVLRVCGGALVGA